MRFTRLNGRSTTRKPAPSHLRLTPLLGLVARLLGRRRPLAENRCEIPKPAMLADSSKHTEDLTERLFSSAYTSSLVFDMDPYVDVQPKDPSTDLLHRILYRVLPPCCTTTDRLQEFRIAIRVFPSPK